MVGKVEAPEKANMMEPKAVKKISMNPEKCRSSFHTWTEGQRALVRAQRVLLKFLQAWRVERKITFVRFYRDALRHICVTAGA
jgi:hypothetical protein